MWKAMEIDDSMRTQYFNIKFNPCTQETERSAEVFLDIEKLKPIFKSNHNSQKNESKSGAIQILENKSGVIIILEDFRIGNGDSTVEPTQVDNPYQTNIPLNTTHLHHQHTNPENKSCSHNGDPTKHTSGERNHPYPNPQHHEQSQLPKYTQHAEQWSSNTKPNLEHSKCEPRTTNSSTSPQHTSDAEPVLDPPKKQWIPDSGGTLVSDE